MFQGKIQSLRYSAEDISFEADDVMESCDILLEQVADNDFLLATPVFRPLTSTSSMLAAAPAVSLDGSNNNTSALYAPPGGGRAGMNRMRSCSLSSEQGGRGPSSSTTSRAMSSRNRSSSILSGFSTFDLNSAAAAQHQGVYLEHHGSGGRDDMGYIIEGEDEDEDDDDDEFFDRGAAIQFFESECYLEEEEEEDDNTSSLGENDHTRDGEEDGDDMDMPNSQNTDRTPKVTKPSSTMRLAPQTSNAAAAAAAAAAQQKKKQGRPTKSDPMQIPKANSNSHTKPTTTSSSTSAASTATAHKQEGKKRLASSQHQQSNSEKASPAPQAPAAPPPPPPAPVSMTMEEMIAHRRSLGVDMLGIYSPGSRRRRVLRFVEKRDIRVWKKKVKYDVRKNFADSRLRVKGRFVKKGDEDLLREYMQFV